MNGDVDVVDDLQVHPVFLILSAKQWNYRFSISGSIPGSDLDLYPYPVHVTQIYVYFLHIIYMIKPAAFYSATASPALF